MKMKLFFAAVAMVFSMAVVSSCGNKESNADAKKTSVEATTRAANDDCCKADTTCVKKEACCHEGDSVACCKEEAACNSEKACCDKK